MGLIKLDKATQGSDSVYSYIEQHMDVGLGIEQFLDVGSIRQGILEES
jgi:hypothetical protein